MTEHNYNYPNAGQKPVVTAKQANGRGTAGFILALLGLIFVWVPIIR